LGLIIMLLTLGTVFAAAIPVASIATNSNARAAVSLSVFITLPPLRRLF